MSNIKLTIKPNVDTLSIEQLHLSAPNREALNQLLEEFQYLGTLKKFNLPVDNKILLHGATGCGKTTTAKAIAKALNKKLITLHLGGFVSSRLGETAKNITSVFRSARIDDAVLFIDEFDFLGKTRDYDEKDSGEMKRLVNSLIQQIDSLDSNVMLICATNYVEIIDAALLRRFQVRLEYNLPNKEQLDNYYKDLLSNFPEEYTNFERKYNISYAEAKDWAQQNLKTQIIKSEKQKRQLLFSYGTLQLEKVQLETYGRKLNGVPDKLLAYKLENLKIKDKSVVEKSEQEFHPIAIKTENKDDLIEGFIFEITTEELFNTDKYEVKDYKRVLETFASGKQAWVYIENG